MGRRLVCNTGFEGSIPSELSMWKCPACLSPLVMGSLYPQMSCECGRFRSHTEENLSFRYDGMKYLLMTRRGLFLHSGYPDQVMVLVSDQEMGRTTEFALTNAILEEVMGK